MTADDVRKLIREKVEQFGSQALLALHMEVSQQYISGLLSGRRDIPTHGDFLDALGLECRITWRKL